MPLIPESWDQTGCPCTFSTSLLQIQLSGLPLELQQNTSYFPSPVFISCGSPWPSFPTLSPGPNPQLRSNHPKLNH